VFINRGFTSDSFSSSSCTGHACVTINAVATEVLMICFQTNYRRLGFTVMLGLVRSFLVSISQQD